MTLSTFGLPPAVVAAALTLAVLWAWLAVAEYRENRRD